MTKNIANFLPFVTLNLTFIPSPICKLPKSIVDLI